jgi:hypothetical protein
MPENSLLDATHARDLRVEKLKERQSEGKKSGNRLRGCPIKVKD